MFGSLGVPELVLIFIVALLLFGPRKLPQIGRSVGRAMGEFRRASNEFKRTIEDEVAAEDIRDVQREVRGTAAMMKGETPPEENPAPKTIEPPKSADDAGDRDQQGSTATEPTREP